MKHPVLNDPDQMQELIGFMEGDHEDSMITGKADEEIQHWEGVKAQYAEAHAKYARAESQIRVIQQRVRDARAREAARKQLNSAIDRVGRTVNPPKPQKGF